MADNTASSVDVQPGKAVTVSLEDLRSGSIPFATLEEAFGPSSLGIIVVKDLPDKFVELRTRALANASYLAALEGKELASLESPSSSYLTGWSHGRETLRPGVVDTFKGSYYINCAFYQGLSWESEFSQLSEKFPGFETYTSPNIWPDASSLPTFRESLEELITLIIDTAVLVARVCDRYATETGIEGYKPGYLEHVVKTSLTTKARLLHYFPQQEQDAAPAQEAAASNNHEPASSSSTNTTTTATTTSSAPLDDDWCATHKDHGCLTGLTSAMFVDESAPSLSPSQPFSDTNPISELATSPDPSSGLYILSRSNTITKINIPRNCLAFQTGETLELITRGKFRAVPHYVKGVKPSDPPMSSTNETTSSTSSSTGHGGHGGHDPTTTTNTTNDITTAIQTAVTNIFPQGTQPNPTVQSSRIARNTLAVFTQPNLDEVVDSERGITFGEFAGGVVRRNTAT